MKHALRQLLLRAGYDLRRATPTFIPFVRHFAFPGCTFDFWIANQDATWWYAEAVWQTAGELAELARLVKSGDRVLEVGAHHGFTGIICAHFVGPAGFVVGLEAHPWNAMIGSAQLGLNPALKNLRFINAAGSEQKGTIKVIAENHNSSVATTTTTATVEVPARTGDDLDKEFGPFNLLKIDVEGFETKVLEGCRGILRRRPNLAIEVHLDEMPKYGTSVTELFELINIKDYAGGMVIRPDRATVRPFAPGQMPASGIVNLFLSPR